MRVATTIAGSLLLALLLAGCGGFTYHRVESGETLYSISWRYGLDYRDVARWNRLPPPYTIYEGQPLRILPPEGQAAAAPSPAAMPSHAPVPAPVATVRAAPASASPASSASSPAASSWSAAALHWQWPARGRLRQTFSETDIGRKGIDIGGTPGEAIHAAAAGKVVYAGSGLLHYGNLIIVKHNDNYLSAYAYNRALRVHEGDAVAAGQHIADMGGRGDDALLHFEIRYDGHPVNPLKYLPAQGQ